MLATGVGVQPFEHQSPSFVPDLQGLPAPDLPVAHRRSALHRFVRGPIRVDLTAGGPQANVTESVSEKLAGDAVLENPKKPQGSR